MHKKGINFRGLYYYSWWKTHFLGKKNILIAYYAMEICYFNFEDIVLISEWLVYENIFTSFYILKYKFQTHTLDKNSKPLVLCVIKSIASLRHVLMEYGVRVTLYRVVFLSFLRWFIMNFCLTHLFFQKLTKTYKETSRIYHYVKLEKTLHDQIDVSQD